jgi:hypothetical protein
VIGYRPCCGGSLFVITSGGGKVRRRTRVFQDLEMRTIMKVKLLAGVAALGLMSATAASADPNGWYGAVDAGFHTMEDGINAESSTTGANWNWKVAIAPATSAPCAPSPAPRACAT